jgi:3-dehydroquinate dehydratase/shikimate dehydrogenase
MTVEAPDEIHAALSDARRAVELGADMVEWRVDALAECEDALRHVRTLVRESPAPCIVTIRSAREGGEWHGNEADRVSFLEALCTADGEPAPAYIDFELADAQRSSNLRQKLELCVEHPGQVRTVGTRLILSAHDFEGRPASLLRQWTAMAESDACAVAKVAWRARSVRDNIEAFELLATRVKPAVVLCMGEAGLMSRVLAPKFGAFLTFAHAGNDSDAQRAAAKAAGTAPGQVSVEEMINVYGFRGIDPATRVFGVIGWPVGHSRSPHVHNEWFREAGRNAVLLPMPIPPEYEHFKATVAELLTCAPLDFRGACVTLPHKEHLVRFVHEHGGHVDPLAVRIGAANTLYLDASGVLRCANTDAPAATDALTDGMGITRAELREKRIAVLGAGGVARAVAVGLAHEGARVVVFNRNEDRARRMCEHLKETAARARDVGASGAAAESMIVAGRLSEIGCGCFHAFVNCTPVGMDGGPDPQGNPLADDVPLDDTITVMDTVYTPRETPLLRESRSRGARTVDGWAMFMKQAERQFRLWHTD